MVPQARLLVNGRGEPKPLSHPVATACLPTSVNSFRVALKMGPKFAPLKPAEVEEMKRKGMAVEPMFRA